MTLSSSLGKLLPLVSERFPNAISNAELALLIAGGAGDGKRALDGALAILYAFGVLRLENGAVAATSRDSAYFLASFAKFLETGLPAIDDPNDHLHRYREVTKILEQARIDPTNTNKIDQQPIHRRRVVNVLVKSRMKRNWRSQDVFLHFYHHGWNQYHLIGRSQHDNSETDTAIAARAMREQLGLEPDQYEFDEVRNPNPITLIRISETHGALTEYTFKLVVVKSINVRLSLGDGLKQDPKRFRWFTLDEIRACRGMTGEIIMFSTPRILNPVEPATLPISTRNADDARTRASISAELGNRFTQNELIVGILCLAALLLVQFLPYAAATLIGKPIPLLQNLASISSILAALVAVIGLIRAVVSKS